MNRTLTTKEDVDSFLQTLQRRLYSAIGKELSIEAEMLIGVEKQEPSGREYQTFRGHPSKFTASIKIDGGSKPMIFNTGEWK